MDESGPDQQLNTSSGSAAHPARRRIALTMVITLLVATAAWLLFLRADRGPIDPVPDVNSSEPGAPAGASPLIDVASFPVGALAGEPAPEISVQLFDGAEFVLSRHLSVDGRPVVLNLWASWCTPCRREIPEFSHIADSNPEVAFVGVAVEDARGPAEAFAAEVKASYPLGIDEALTVKNGYPFIGLPVTYLIGADGAVVRQIQGQLNAATLQAFIDYDFGN